MDLQHSKLLFLIYGFFYVALSNSGCIAWNGMMIHEWSVKDVEGSLRGLIEGIIKVSAWSDRGKPWKFQLG
jgi:hypothetical protein